mgnify:CR=1 FL=1
MAGPRPLATADASLVIDVTANDAVLERLSDFPTRERTWVSASVGALARRLFLYLVRAEQFDTKDFRERVYPYLAEEKELVDSQTFPREGVGCWHPVFPAQADDMTLLASCAVKELDSFMTRAQHGPKLVVFEQQLDDNGFIVGVERKEVE